MHKGESLFDLHLDGMRSRIRKAFSNEHHLAAQIADSLHFERRCRHRHHDHRAAAQAPSRQGHPLRVVARGSANHAASALFGAQMHHLVESAAKFERKHRLRVFALQKHFVAYSQRKPFSFIKRRFARHIVYAGREDFAQILLAIQFCLCHAYPCFLFVFIRF